MSYPSSYAAEEAITKFEQELLSESDNYSDLAQEVNTLSRQILEIQMRKSDLRNVMRKSKDNSRRLMTELEIAKREFWRNKSSNL